MADLLIDTKQNDVWEDNESWSDIVGKHPNSNGYKFIADELFSFIDNNNLLNYDAVKKSHLI